MMRSLADESTDERRTRGRRTLSRPIVGSLVAVVMLFQSLAVIVLAQAHSGHGVIGPSLNVSSFQANCSSVPIDHSGAPKQERHDCAKCCILCSVRDSAVPFYFAPPLAGAQFGDFRTVASMIRRGVDDEQPAGWASSWSSRAPPSFS